MACTEACSVNPSLHTHEYVWGQMTLRLREGGDSTRAIDLICLPKMLGPA